MATDIFATPPARKILRLPEVEARTGLKRAFIYRMMRLHKFPQNMRIGARAVGWDAAEINEWIEQRMAARPV